MPVIDLPHNGWRPRPYQEALWNAWQKDDVKRILAVWHRRAGKDDVVLHGTAIKAHERVANYWHMLPEYNQARKAIWDAVNAHTGKRRIFEAFPPELIESMNDQEMKIRFKIGSTWQVVGSDRYDSLVGAGVAGVTFSEWALANPSAWAYIRPMIAENEGWATFITTPRGRNHGFSMYNMAREQPSWFAEVLTVDDTGALSLDAQAEALAEYIGIYGEDLGRAMFEQEYLCSFTAAILGAFYAREMLGVRNEGRILAVEPRSDKPVHRAWDIGVGDDTSIWWFQIVGGQPLILDCYTMSGAGVDHYAEVCEERANLHGWTSGIDYVPHDAANRVFALEGAKTIMDQMVKYGLRPQLAPYISKQDGINAARQTLKRAVFHPRCEDVGIAALEQYRREWDDERKTFKATEYRDWTTHLADAFRYLAVAWRGAPAKKHKKPPAPIGGVVLDVPRPSSSTRIVI